MLSSTQAWEDLASQSSRPRPVPSTLLRAIYGEARVKVKRVQQLGLNFPKSDENGRKREYRNGRNKGEHPFIQIATMCSALVGGLLSKKPLFARKLQQPSFFVAVRPLALQSVKHFFHETTAGRLQRLKAAGLFLRDRRTPMPLKKSPRRPLLAAYGCVRTPRSGQSQRALAADLLSNLGFPGWLEMANSSLVKAQALFWSKRNRLASSKHAPP